MTTLAREYTRDDWNARRPKPALAHQGSPTEAFIHHSDDVHGNQWTNLHEQAAKVREIQDFHMDGRGWSDIAYHYVLFQFIGAQAICRAFQGRSVSFVPAAQLNHNTGTLAICVVGNGQVESMRRNTRYVIERLIARYPSIKTVGGHRNVVSTTCPGDEFMRAVPLVAKAIGRKVYR